MSNGILPHFPAQQHRLAIHFTGKIEQANIDIFHLHPNGIDLRKSIFGTLLGLGPLSLPPGDGHNVNVGAAIQEYAMAEFLQLAVYFFH